MAERTKGNFTIEYLLGQRPEPNFSWLHCTRYRPPKIPRARRNEGIRKRKLGRHPRIPFSTYEVAIMESMFKKHQYLNSTQVTELASSLHLSETRVKIWFQNRRARERRENERKISCPEDRSDTSPNNYQSNEVDILQYPHPDKRSEEPSPSMYIFKPFGIPVHVFKPVNSS